MVERAVWAADVVVLVLVVDMEVDVYGNGVAEEVGEEPEEVEG